MAYLSTTRTRRTRSFDDLLVLLSTMLASSLTDRSRRRSCVPCGSHPLAPRCKQSTPDGLIAREPRRLPFRRVHAVRNRVDSLGARLPAFAVALSPTSFQTASFLSRREKLFPVITSILSVVVRGADQVEVPDLAFVGNSPPHAEPQCRLESKVGRRIRSISNT